MRFTPALLALLPALAAAADQQQQQVPLKDQVAGWFEKAKSFIPTANPAAQVAEKVSSAATSGAAGSKATSAVGKVDVTELTMETYKEFVALGEKEREALVYITGGNKTCYGRCGRPDKAWQESLPLFAADNTSPSLAHLDCEKNEIFCNAWYAGPPNVWHLTIPSAPSSPDQPRPETPLHIVRLNVTTVTAQDIYDIHHKKTWAEKPKYEGAFHPTDGFLAQNGLNVVAGYVIYGISAVPSWAMMIVISFVSRSMMTRRLQPQPGRQ